jgi:hypothetical protein
MREIEIHDYARQLLEAHGAKAIADAARNAIDLEAKGEEACRRRHEARAWAASKLKLPALALDRGVPACERRHAGSRPVRRRRRWRVD